MNYRLLACSPADVFAVLSDGWVFPTWVVGASRMREVEAEWPAPGAKLHHSFGTWPLLLDDETTSLEWEPPVRASFQPKGWPLGEARVTIEVKPRPEGCVVRLTEEPVAGPGRMLRLALEPLLHARNTETLRRLAFIAESQSRPAV